MGMQHLALLLEGVVSDISMITPNQLKLYLGPANITAFTVYIHVLFET